MIAFAALFPLACEVVTGGPAFTGCLADARYLDWPPYVTARATALGVEATPTVLVEGAAVRPDTRTITAAVAAAHRGQ